MLNSVLQTKPIKYKWLFYRLLNDHIICFTQYVYFRPVVDLFEVIIFKIQLLLSLFNDNEN